MSSAADETVEFLQPDNEDLLSVISSQQSQTSLTNRTVDLTPHTDESRLKYRNQILYCLEKYQITILATEIGIEDLQLPQISKILLGLLFLLIIFYLYMDVQLYLRIQNYPLERNYHFITNTSQSIKDTAHSSSPSVNAGATASSSSAALATDLPLQKTPVTYESQTWLSCTLNPLCHVTVKAILLDHTNHYLFAPLATIFDNVLGLSRSSYITANMISFFHVGVACIAGRLVASDSLGYRRLGAVMFEFRTFLDDVDGHVARAKKNIRGERSEVGTTGYYIDGICDALGCIALLWGMFHYLKNNPPRRGYLQLPMVDTRVSDASTKTKLKPTTRKVAKKVISFTGQLMLSSTAWNRYIAVYQNMLETNDVSSLQMSHQQIVFKSTWFFCVAWLWRLVNVHSLLHYVLLSIFCDKLWEFLKAIQYVGYVTLLYLQELGWHTKGTIGVVEPHNDPSISLAEKIIFDKEFVDPEESKIKRLSEDSLLRELFVDPILTTYGVVIIDEVYKRSILTDTILALLKKIVRKRGSLKVILVSNTKEASFLKEYFDQKKLKNDKTSSIILSIDDANLFQHIHYLNAACPDYVKKSVETILNIHKQQPVGGDIVVYLADEDEIADAMDLLRNYISAEHIKNLNYFKMCQTKNERQTVFFPKTEGKRNVVFTTKLYQKSVTQDRITYVIDSGFMEVEWFQAEKKRYNKLIVPVCKFTASLRAKWWSKHRAAKVFRLYTKEGYMALPERTLTEMRRSNLCTIVMYLKTLAVDNILRFNFPSAPPAKNLLAALEILNALEALNVQGHLTFPLGYFLADAPLPPMLGRMLFKSSELKCSDEILTIVSMLQVEPVFIITTNNVADSHKQVAKRIFEAAEGDLITLLNVYTAFVENGKSKEFCRKYYLSYRHLMRAVSLRGHLACSVLNKYNLRLISCRGDLEKILRSITAGYFMNIAYLHPTGVYRGLRCGSELYVDRDSSIYTLTQPKYLTYCDLWERSKKTFMQNVTVIKPEWLSELAPHYYKEKSVNADLKK
ncbi:hypothetical protein GQX74_005367 [Glossina fuscipes]|nr:hypothetical protein GQX74_005367 [Glossina fuscipes]